MRLLRRSSGRDASRAGASLVTGAALVCGLLLLAEAAWRLSATYDEVTYLEVAAHWWRTGEAQAITRMGSPLTFWKLQQAPALALLQAAGGSALIDKPIAAQSELLPLVRISSLWIWCAAAGLSALWARRLYGPWSGAFAAWLFALGPNLLGHGGLVTMEMPLLAAATAAFWSFAHFLESGRRTAFAASAIAAGLAFSCKFTAALLPVLLAVPWWLERRASRAANPADKPRHWLWAGRTMLAGLALYALILLATNAVLTGGATLSPSESRGSHPALDRWFGPGLGQTISRLAERPWPQDWVAFATQMRHQAGGGSSYLLGQRRDRGWRQYYLVAMAVKLPLAVVVLALLRLGLPAGPERRPAETLLRAVPVVFFLIATLGSTRNYGFRYLLLVAGPVVVWISALASAQPWTRVVGWLAIGLLGATTLANRPHHLTYFNELAGGRLDGRHILADSNLDWGQGARELATLQTHNPSLTDITTYYFGSTDPGWYGVRGTRHVVDAGEVHPGLPARFVWTSRFAAVSASLQWGPWGPAGYFQELNDWPLAYLTPDGTIAIYDREAQPSGCRP